MNGVESSVYNQKPKNQSISKVENNTQKHPDTYPNTYLYKHIYREREFTDGSGRLIDEESHYWDKIVAINKERKGKERSRNAL